MKELLPIWILLICTTSMIFEIWVVDPYFWKKNKSDKPVSTIVYSVTIAMASSLFLLNYEFWLIFKLSLIGAVFVRLCLFDPVVNISGKLPSGKRPICYHSISDKKGFAIWWENLFLKNNIKCWQEMLGRFTVLGLGVYLSFKV